MGLQRTTQTIAHLASVLALTTVLAGCNGGGSNAAPVSKPPASGSPVWANATVRILWPSRTAPQDALRKALYISQDTNHIKVTNYYPNSFLTPSDTTVTIPFGQVQASIPAYVGDNNWHFAEFYADEGVGEVAGGDGYLTITDPNAANSIDVVLNLNVTAMGVNLASDNFSGCILDSIYLNGGTGKIQFNDLTAHTFNLYLQPTDRGPTGPTSGRIATGPGSPGLSLTTTDTRLTLTRFTNPNSSGPYAGIAYQVKMNQPLSSSLDQIVLQANYLDRNNFPLPVGSINIKQCGGE